ncbi:hypothetical protein SBV1_1710028 [Verrucomicrobia bacterium]|nr:hypothetical protein SBV1_1710028 [Verrucomicrobiota bacterium]
MLQGRWPQVGCLDETSPPLLAARHFRPRFGFTAVSPQRGGVPEATLKRPPRPLAS